jgi:hypothetical protein
MANPSDADWTVSKPAPHRVHADQSTTDANIRAAPWSLPLPIRVHCLLIHLHKPDHQALAACLAAANQPSTEPFTI